MNRFFKEIYDLISWDRDGMTGNIRFQTARIVMEDIGLTRKERVEWYKKASLVESIRQESSKKDKDNKSKKQSKQKTINPKRVR